jgi:hypothetical protein
LRHALLLLTTTASGINHLGCQHSVNERERRPFRDLRLQPRHQALMVDTVEGFLEVEIDDPLVPVGQIPLRLGDSQV